MLADSQIYKTVQRSNTTTILLSIIGLVIVGILTYLFFLPYWTSMLGAPREIARGDLRDLAGDETYYNVVVSGRELIPEIGYYEQTKNGSVTNTDYYHALYITGNTYLLVFSSSNMTEDDTTLSGTLMPIDSGTMRDIVNPSIESAGSSVEFMPLMLDVRHNEFMWYLGTGGLAILGLASVWGIFSFISNSSNPTNHPTLKRLGRFGEVEQVVDSIEKDLAMSEEKLAKLRLTRSWLISSGGTKFEAMPYHSIAWVYKMIIHGKYGSKTYQAHFHDKTGVSIVVIDNENNVNAMLQAVASRAPWAIAGYNNDIKRSWDKDRANFIAEVNRRQAELQRQQ